MDNLIGFLIISSPFLVVGAFIYILYASYMEEKEGKERCFKMSMIPVYYESNLRCVNIQDLR